MLLHSVKGRKINRQLLSFTPVMSTNYNILWTFISNLHDNGNAHYEKLGYFMKTIIYTVSFLAFLSINITANAGQFYKWVDENGVTHYSERPPHKKEAESIKTRAQTDTQKQTQQAAEQSAKAEAAAEKEKPKQEESKSEPELKKDPSLCKKAQKELDVLKRTPIVRRNGKVMSIDEKNEAIGNMRDIIKVNC